MISTDALDSIRGISVAAFGQRHRLELMLEVADADEGIVSLTDLSRGLNVTMSSLQRPFESLVATALLTPLPLSESRYKHFLRNASPAWDWAYDLASVAGVTLQRGSWRESVVESELRPS